MLLAIVRGKLQNTGENLDKNQRKMKGRKQGETQGENDKIVVGEKWWEIGKMDEFQCKFNNMF